MQKGFVPILVLILAIAGLIGGAYYLGTKSSLTLPSQQKACTLEAKICPDGSSVGRTGPNCEFSPCPTAVPTKPLAEKTSDWAIYTGETAYTQDGSSSFSIEYPSIWEREGDAVYPFGKRTEDGTDARIILGAGGHGAPAHQEIKTYPAGQAYYYWGEGKETIFAYATFSLEKYSYIFEVNGLPIKYSQEYKVIFDKMLSTFKFTSN